MSEAKCPLCGGDSIQSEEFPCFYSCQSTNWKSDDDKLCELDDCAASVPVWETLRHTKKQLEIALDALEYIRRTNPISFHFEAIEKALAEITALEQKDEK
jgi:hypothetical protein